MAYTANYIIYCAGSMGYGKTMLATIMTLSERYKYVFANYLIEGLERHNKKFQLVKTFKEVQDIQNREDKEEKGVLIIDEVNINLPNTWYMSKQNTELAKFAILSRKANIDIILTWVDFFSMDVRFRRIVHTLFNMEKPTYKATNINLNWQKRQKIESSFRKEATHKLVGYQTLQKADLILQEAWLWYDTTASWKLY